MSAKIKKFMIAGAIVLLIVLTVAIVFGVRRIKLCKTSKMISEAIIEGDVDRVKELVDANPSSVNLPSTAEPYWLIYIAQAPDVTFPLHTACGFGNYEAAKYLIENGADCNIAYKGTNSSMTPLMYVCFYGDESNAIKIAQLLLEHNADKAQKDQRGKTAYDYAVEKGYMNLAELFKP